MGRTDAASRTVGAPATRVYRALVDPDAVARWLPPAGMTARVLAFEPRPGGAYAIELAYAGEAGRGKTSETTDVTEGRFVELEPGRKVVQAVAFRSDDPAMAGEMRITWRLAPLGEATELTVVCEDVPEGILREDHEQGLRSTLDNLARFVEARDAAPP